MNFVNPALAMAGLACVAIPIVIHLLMRRRRKPVQWAAMRFLMEAYRQQRRRLRLEQLLLLAARCLVIALVALALGRPFFGEAAAFGGRGTMTLYLLIDNSLASSAQVGGPSALDRHKEAAANLLRQLDPAAGDRAALVVLGGPAQPLVVPPTSDTGALREMVRTLEPTDSAADLPGGLAFVASELGGESSRTRTVVAVLSDFLTGSADTDRVLSQLVGAAEGGRTASGRARENIVLLVSRPSEAGVNNISITGVEPLRPVIIAGGSAEATSAHVSISLRRTGPRTGEAAVTTVRLAMESERAGSTPAGQAVIRWSPGQTEATTSVPFDTSRVPAPARGLGAATSVVLTASIDPDAITGDDTWRRPVEVRRALRVGIVAPRRLGLPGGGPQGLHQFEPSDWVRLALAPMQDGLRTGAAAAEIEVTELEPTSLDATRLAGLDAAIITRPDLIPEPSWSRLRNFADAGGLIVVMPPHQTQVHLWPDAMARELGLNWNIAREARQYEQRAAIAPDRLSADPSGQNVAGLLVFLRQELPDLAPPVGITRVLPVEAPTEDPGDGDVAGSRRTGAILHMNDGAPLMLASPPGARDEGEHVGRPSRGLVVFIATAFNFEWTDLHARPLMVPLLHEVVRQGVGQAIGSHVQLAGSEARLPARTVELRSAGELLGERAIVRVNASGARTEEPLRHAGLWHAVDDRGVTRSTIAVNADPRGGRGNAQPAQAIHDWLSSALPGGEWGSVQWLDAAEPVGPATADAGSLHTIFDRRADDTAFALPLLIAALLFAFVELVMARWFSHGTRPVASPVTPAVGPART